MIRKARSSMATCGIVTLMTALNASAVEQSTFTEVLKPLNLSGYSSSMWPPEFRGETSDGKMLSLTGLPGKVVVVNFWATWCLECRPEMPMFERLHREFSGQGLAVVGINAREGTARVREYAKELGLTFPLILDPSGKFNSAYGVIGLPITFLIGRPLSVETAEP